MVGNEIQNHGSIIKNSLPTPSKLTEFSACGCKENSSNNRCKCYKKGLLPLKCANVKTGYTLNMHKVNKTDLNINSNVSDYREAGRKLNYFRLFWIPVL